MSLTGIRKDILELKRAAALENKQSEDYCIKNMTDEELQEEINRELEKLGFKSEEEFFDAAKRYFAESGLKTSFNNGFEFQNYVFEQFDERLEDFLLKYGILRESEYEHTVSKEGT
jgi:hypothetical protein